MGYLRAEHAYRIGKALQGGHTFTAIFQEATRYGAAIRIAFDGEIPLLPEKEQDVVSEDIEPDFYPDDIWPDD